MKKQTATKVTIILEIVLFSVGSFFLYWGALCYRFGRPEIVMFFGFLMMIFGVAVMVFSFLNSKKLYAFLLGQLPPP